MAPQRKVARSNKKKNKGNKSTKEKETNSTKTQEKSSTVDVSSKSPVLPSGLTDTLKHISKTSSIDTESHYQQYKQSTEKFRNGLRSLLPSTFPLSKVNDLAKACDFIFDASIEVREIIDEWENITDDDMHPDGNKYLTAINNLEKSKQDDIIQKFKFILIPQNLLLNLEACIRLRSDVSNLYKDSGSSDDGHDHVMKVLEYCNKILNACWNVTVTMRKILKKTLRRKKNVTPIEIVDESAEVKVENLSNRFSAFAIIDDDNEEDSDDEEADLSNDVKDIIQNRKDGIDTSPISDKTDIYSIEEDLIQGNDRLQACSFLLTMEMLMELVAKHYRMLKNKTKATESPEPVQLMHSAMATNICINSVQCAEAALAINYPYLSSFYSVLVLVCLPSMLALFEAEILLNASEETRKKCTRASVIVFLGNIVECCFHNKGALGRQHDFTRKFCKRNKLDDEKVQKIVQNITLITNLEIKSLKNKEEYAKIARTMQMQGIDLPSLKHKWLENSQYIGGSRSLLNTLRWSQCIISLSTIDTKLESIPGFFGKLWDENKNPAKKIQGDLDELFCGSILPELLEWCKKRIVKKNPHLLDALSLFTPNTLPLIQKFRDHMKYNEDGPIPAHLAFSFHCLLTSILEMQGNNHIERLAKNAERSWNTLFVRILLHRKEFDTPNSESFFDNMYDTASLRHLPTVQGPPSSKISAQMAFYNPLMAGNYLLFANYVVGIGLGSCCVDSCSQVRFVLHIYNTCRQIGAFNANAVPLLEELYVLFKNLKSIWVLKDYPKQGDFCKRFLMSHGFSSQGAEIQLKIIKEVNKGNCSDDQVITITREDSR